MPSLVSPQSYPPTMMASQTCSAGMSGVGESLVSSFSLAPAASSQRGDAVAEAEAGRAAAAEAVDAVDDGRENAAAASRVV